MDEWRLCENLLREALGIFNKCKAGSIVLPLHADLTFDAVLKFLEVMLGFENENRKFKKN